MINYAELLRSIQQQKCALIIGPNACLMNDGRSTFSSNIADEVRESAKPIKHYCQDDLYYIPARSDRTWVSNLVHSKANDATRDLINPEFYTKLYQHITELPFHLIISLSPDKFLFTWMKHR